MRERLSSLRADLRTSLAFVPSVIVLTYFVLGIVLVEVDRSIDLEGVSYVFSGDGSAARTVLSVVAGSLITVAGLTFSITIVVLQLAAGQFSPRVLRTFFSDRITQVTIGTFVGIFVYSLLVLRAVGSFGDAGFVPRLSVTLASLLAIGAVVLLVVFLHHVALMIQVSHVVADVAGQTRERIGERYPRRVAEAVGDEDAAELRRRWTADAAPGRVLPDRTGFVRSVGDDAMIEALRAAGAERATVLARPGDLVSLDTVLVEVWPDGAAERGRHAIRGAMALADERDLEQDLGFGLRQLADIALKAMSPAINDPATAVTAVGHLRSLLVTLAACSGPAPVRRSEGLVVAVRPRTFAEDLEVVLQIGRAAGAEAWVVRELVALCSACARAAGEAGSPERATAAISLGEAIGRQGLDNAGNDLDAETLRSALEDLRRAAAEAGLGGRS